VLFLVIKFVILIADVVDLIDCFCFMDLTVCWDVDVDVDVDMDFTLIFGDDVIQPI
jgi:hypothetical protein